MSQELFTGGSSFTLVELKPTTLVISNLVSINLTNGEITFLPGYTPEAAARAFWEAMSDDYRKMLRWKEEVKAAPASAAAATESDMRAFGASEAACYKWPEDTPEHRLARQAYCEGAADTSPTARDSGDSMK